jgi:uncharacterized protein (TIGR00369 family)
MSGSDSQDGENTDAALALLAHELARPPFHGFLDPKPVSVDAKKGVVVVAIAAKPEFRRSPDEEDWHGGVLAALIDLTAHAAVAVRTGKMAPTIDLRIDYLRGAVGDLTATGRLLRAGRTIARSDVEVRDAAGRLVTVGRGTFSTSGI